MSCAVSTIQTGTAARATIPTGAAAKVYAASSGHEAQYTDAEKGLADYEKHHKASSTEEVLGKLWQTGEMGMNIIDAIDPEEAMRVDDPDWTTYWDDEQQCWMMAELIYHNDELVNIDWENAISCEDYISQQRQEAWLIQRYGEVKPKSIVDYWVR